MSYATVPAYVQYVRGWDPKYREHPVIDWMFDYEALLDWGDLRKGPHTPWHADDFFFTKPSGERIQGGAKAWASMLELYAPYTSYYHEPRFYIIWETATGWELIGSATVYAKLAAPGEATKTDGEGRKWDIEAPGAFHFVYVKDPTGPKGLKLQGQSLFADGMPIIGEMLKRGMVTPEQVLAPPP